MTTRQADNTDVLIVGAGPVGATAALLCARLGLRAIVVERRERRHGPPKAHALNPRSLEICRALGIDHKRIARISMPPEDGGFVRFVTGLAGMELGALPYERQDPGALDATPTPLLNVPQPAFEDLLLEEMAREPAIELRRPQTWTAAVEDGDRVVSTIVDGGGSYRISSRYVLACDGAESAVRKSLGIDMPGDTRIEDRIMIHFEADLRALLKDRPGVLYFIVDPAAPATLIAYDLASTYVLMHRYDSRVDPADGFTPERCEALVRRAIGDAIPFAIQHISPWTMTALVAEKYRVGRIFLCGDAAHRFPPSGGLGLNSGMQDAHNLIWKLAATEAGSADPSLLDSYQSERQPIAAAYSAQSHANALRMGQLFAYVAEQYKAAGGDAPATVARLASADCRAAIANLLELQRPHFDSFGLQLGFRYGDDETWRTNVSDFTPQLVAGVRLSHAWIDISGARLSTLDLVDVKRFTLICEDDAAIWRDLAAEARAPLKVVTSGVDFTDFSGAWAHLLQSVDAAAVLVRPDGHIACVVRNDAVGRQEIEKALRAGTCSDEVASA